MSTKKIHDERLKNGTNEFRIWTPSRVPFYSYGVLNSQFECAFGVYSSCQRSSDGQTCVLPDACDITCMMCLSNPSYFKPGTAEPRTLIRDEHDSRSLRPCSVKRERYAQRIIRVTRNGLRSINSSGGRSKYAELPLGNGMLVLGLVELYWTAQ